MTVTYNLHSGLTGWTGPFGYVVGNRVVNAGNAYQCITSGTSASGAGPTTTASNITDGTVHWKWLSAVDFTSLSAAAAALPATFTQPIIWLLWNDGTISIPGANTPYLTLTGHTTTSTNNLTITCAPGESIRDSLHTGQVALAFNAAAGVSITLPTTAPGFHVDYFSVFDANVVIDGLQFKDPNAVNAPIGCSILAVNTSATNFVMRNCIIDCTAQANMTQLGFYGTPYTVANCLFVDRQPAAGGQIAIKAEALGTFVNNTHIGINSPAGTYAILSNYNINSDPFALDFSSAFGSGAAPASPIIVRNTACFGYTGIGVAVAFVGAIAVDHSATSGSSIGSNVTNSGGNLVSQSAATTFLSTTTDFRLTLGASSGNAAVTDTIDIPAADDIARTPRTVWDIGAFELVPLQMRGGAISQGRAGPRTSVPARGLAKADAKSLLTISVGLIGRGVTKSVGAASAGLILGSSGRPWSSAFSSAFGPLGTSATVSAGLSATTGRSAVTIALPLAAKGIARSSGRPPTLFVALALVARASTKANATAAMTASLSINARAQSAGRGRSAIAGVAALAAAARSTTAGKSATQYIAGLSTRGKASARASFSNAILGYRSLGRAAASGLSLAVYRAPPTRVNIAIAAASGRAGITSQALLTASGSGVGSSFSLFGDQQLVLQGRGGAGATGQSIDLHQDAVLLAQALANAKATGLVGVALPILARTLGADAGRGTARYTAFLSGRGLGGVKGAFTPATLSIAMRSAGTSGAKGKGVAQYNALQSTTGTARGSGRTAFSGALPLNSRGVATLAGQIGSIASQRLSALGVASGQGRVTLQSAALLHQQGASATSGRVNSAVLAQSFTALGVAFATATASLTSFRPLAALGASRARSLVAPKFVAALMAVGSNRGAARSSINQIARLAATGFSGAVGRIAAPVTNAALNSRGVAKGFGASGGFGFAPVALTAQGSARGFSLSGLDPELPLSGLGIGLSEGRCRTIATLLLQASGRSRAQGVLSAAAAVGFVARGRADARGRLYATLAIQARGRAVASGSALIAGLYNVTPDTQGPTLSTLTSLPVFDSMDIGDTDFFSFDWSSRMSATRDPIASASVLSVPPGLSIGPVAISGTIVQVRCGSTTSAETFSLRCSVTLRSGRVLHWSAPVSVEDF